MSSEASDATTDPPGREALRAHLREIGVPERAIAAAADEDRLVLLPAETILSEPPRFSMRDLAGEVGLEVEVLARFTAALGLPVPPDDAVVAGGDDLEAARSLAAFLAAGLPLEPLLEVVRVGGQAAAALSRAIVGLAGSALLHTGDTELELAQRFARMARDLLPHLSIFDAYAVRRHLLETVRGQVLSQAEVAAGAVATTTIAVAFADLSGFTRLGARVDAEETGRVASRLAELAARSTQGRHVEVVKLVGDAAMLVSRNAALLLETLLDLEHAVEAEGEDYPALHCGAAHGQAVARAGDFFGHTVTLASRLSGLARPGTILIDQGMHAAVAGDPRFDLSQLRHHRVRGVDARVVMYRVRRAELQPERRSL